MFYGKNMAGMMGRSAQMASAGRAPQKSPMGAVAGMFGTRKPQAAPAASPMMGRAAGMFGAGQRPAQMQNAPMGRMAGMFGTRGAGPAMGGVGSAVGRAFGGAAPGASPGAMPQMQRAAALMSDRQSKERIAELDAELDRTYAALEGARAEYPETGTPHRLDDEFRKPTANTFEYKPEFRDQPGAGRGRFTGPMTDELKGIPGVVSRDAGGMERVNEPRLTMANTSQIAAQRREIDDLKSQLEALEGDPDAVLERASGRRRK